MELLDQLCREMIAYDKGDPRRIHHFLKVHAFAEQIGREEGIPEKQLFVWKRPLMSMISGFIGAKWSSAGMMEDTGGIGAGGSTPYIGKTRIRDGRY